MTDTAETGEKRKRGRPKGSRDSKPRGPRQPPGVPRKPVQWRKKEKRVKGKSKEKVVCGARKRDGTPCQKPPVEGRTRCRLHGGATPVGAANPNFKHGKVSKYMPTHLLERFQEALGDPAYIELRESFALVDTRIAQLLERVDSAESGQRWREARTAMRKLTGAMQSGDTEAVGTALNELNLAINRGAQDYQNWGELVELVRERRHLTDTETRRIKAAEEYLSAQDAIAIVRSISESVKTHVKDLAARQAIAADLARIIGGPSHPDDL